MLGKASEGVRSHKMLQALHKKTSGTLILEIAVQLWAGDSMIGFEIL